MCWSVPSAHCLYPCWRIALEQVFVTHHHCCLHSCVSCAFLSWQLSRCSSACAFHSAASMPAGASVLANPGVALSRLCDCCCRTASSQSRMVYLSPVPKDQSSAPLHTPSPSGRNPISIFGLAQTPGMPGMLSRFPGTPVSDAMTAASWLHDMSLRHPQQVSQVTPTPAPSTAYDT